MSGRRWYRLHWATWLALFLVGGTFLWRQTFQIASGWNLVHGWPVKVLTNWDVGGVYLKLHTLGLILDLGAAAALLASTGIVLERWTRHHWQLRIASWFRLTAVAGVLLAISQAEIPYALPFSLYSWLYSHEIELIPLSPSNFPSLPPLARAPIIFALGCTIYTVGWLVVRLAARCASMLRAPASPASGTRP